MKNIGIFGFGNMGKAIFELLKNEKDFRFFINSLRKVKVSKAKWRDSLEELIKSSDLIFICVKPQNFRELEGIEAKNKTIISIMAGITLQELSQKFKGAKVIRTMPNLPLQIGEGVIAWYYQKDKFKSKESNMIRKILSSFGKLVLLKKENDIHSLTAIAGCGPAYVFSFLNALIKSAMDLGFTKKEAKLIVDATVSGSLYYYRSQDLEPDELIKMISSKKGITEQALKELDLKKFYNTWGRVTKRAYQRSKEMGR
jgi:pyrroline-5-carboxylate reductase